MMKGLYDREVYPGSATILPSFTAKTRVVSFYFCVLFTPASLSDVAATTRRGNDPRPRKVVWADETGWRMQVRYGIGTTLNIRKAM
jgi:hypothetical protein